MITLKFKCTLLSDVILNQKAATEGPNQTLDFIPGSCFLGIVASGDQYDKFDKEGKAWEVFHSGKVCFGDAHPSIDSVRGLRIPASMFYPKLSRVSDGEVYIHHAVPDLESDKMKQKQLKQCRNGFYVFTKDEAKQVITETNFALKSAYDNKTRRSKDEKLFGYESLQQGLELRFEVVTENDDLANDIKESLVGKKRVGRSRTAQYGLVEIAFLDDKDNDLSTNETTHVNGKKCVTVYADGRLIFLDDYGLPTFKPSASQLGLPENAEILWDMSQIRTFQYAPWNYKRQCFDTDRCGIEKGSVFVVDVSKCGILPELKSHYLGSYNNEGFGMVIYNPEFLKADESGKVLYPIVKPEDDSKPQRIELKGFPLLDYVASRLKQSDSDNEVYSIVNKWVDENQHLFQGKEKFASQWGAIRGIVMATKEDKRIKDNVNAYLTHGVKSSDWDGIRLNRLEEFLSRCNDGNIRIALINLAAEMAKKCRKEDN